MAGLLTERVGSRVALATVAVWAAFPAAVSLQLAYTESLAMLVLCGFLWAVIRQRWAVTAALALVLGLTRPIALPAARRWWPWRSSSAGGVGPSSQSRRGEVAAGARGHRGLRRLRAGVAVDRLGR